MLQRSQRLKLELNFFIIYKHSRSIQFSYNFSPDWTWLHHNMEFFDYSRNDIKRNWHSIMKKIILSLFRQLSQSSKSTPFKLIRVNSKCGLNCFWVNWLNSRVLKSALMIEMYNSSRIFIQKSTWNRLKKKQIDSISELSYYF